jgi:hypothetical protein
MSEHIVKIISIRQVTHDVKKFRVEKPSGYSFTPGQATEVSINTKQFKDEKRPFTFTCLTSDPFLEFIIKIYPSHDGVTKELGKLESGAELILRDVWGAISYKGKGVFIASLLSFQFSVILKLRMKFPEICWYLQIKQKATSSLKKNLRICWGMHLSISCRMKKSPVITTA